MSSVSVSRRRKTAFADATAAKQRRQKIIIIVGCVLLALILAYEVPHTLKLVNKSSATPAASSTSSSVVSAPTTAAAAATGSKALRKLRKHFPVDPFSSGQVAGGVPAYGAVAGPKGLHDPFVSTGSSSSSSAVSTSSTPATTSTPVVHILPKQIVIGAPGAGRIASHGWIMILASVPTGQGRSKATQVAKQARNHGLTFVSILNSSKSRPLRGGYWVVYTGPYPTLGSVNTAAKHVHSSGFGDAYVRELIVYKSKGK
jgi:hypothetical protein